MDRTFVPEFVLSQLEYAGAITFLDLLKSGYPSRVNFVDLYDKFKSFLPAEVVDPKKFCKALLQSMGWEKEFEIGKTKLFLQVGKIAEFDRMMKSDEMDMRLITDTYKASVIRSKWTTIITCISYFLKRL